MFSLILQMVNQGTVAYAGGGLLRDVKNKAVLCKPLTLTKATYCKPHMQSKLLQTGTCCILFRMVLQIFSYAEVDKDLHMWCNDLAYVSCVYRCRGWCKEGICSCAHPCACVHPCANEYVFPGYSDTSLSAFTGKTSWTHEFNMWKDTNDVSVNLNKLIKACVTITCYHHSERQCSFKVRRYLPIKVWLLTKKTFIMLRVGSCACVPAHHSAGCRADHPGHQRTKTWGALWPSGGGSYLHSWRDHRGPEVRYVHVIGWRIPLHPLEIRYIINSLLVGILKFLFALKHVEECETWKISTARRESFFFSNLFLS